MSRQVSHPSGKNKCFWEAQTSKHAYILNLIFLIPTLWESSKLGVKKRLPCHGNLIIKKYNHGHASFLCFRSEIKNWPQKHCTTTKTVTTKTVTTATTIAHWRWVANKLKLKIIIYCETYVPITSTVHSSLPLKTFLFTTKDATVDRYFSKFTTSLLICDFRCGNKLLLRHSG